MNGFVLAAVAAFLFGLSTPASKLLLESFEPFQLAGLLYLGAAVGTLPIVLMERRGGARLPLDRRNGLRLGGAVFFGGVLGPVLLLFGLRLTLAGSVSLLLNFEMVATAVLGVLFFREPLTRRGWMGVAGVAIAGAILAGEGGWPGLLAALFVLAACLCWGLDNHFTALIDGITPARSTFVKGSIAGITNSLVGWGGTLPEAALGPALAALGVGVFSYGASITLYISAAQQLGATRAQAVFASAPFVGALLAFAVLGEPFGLAHLLASALLVASIALLMLGEHGHAHTHDKMEHVHSHRHDDGHHLHEHAGQRSSLRHSHLHRHEPVTHAHPHWPDLHHRHGHGDD